MKALFGGCSIVGLCYGFYLVTQISVAAEMVTSYSDCLGGATSALQTSDFGSANKVVDKGCARLVRNADVSEKVLNKLP